MAAFFKKYRRDVVYLFVILGLVGWVGLDFQGKLNRALIDELSRSSELGCTYSRILFDHYFEEIRKEEYAFPEKNKQVWERAVHIHILIDKAKEVVENTIHARYAEGGPKHKLSANEIQALQLTFRGLADSLALCLEEDDPYFQKAVAHYLYSESAAYSKPNWATLSSSIGPNQALAGLQNLKYMVCAAGITAIDACYRKTQPQGTRCPGFMPILSTTRSVLHPGELFKADIFLTEYSPKSENISVFVDNKPVKIIDGLAPYRRRFSTPGVHKFDVRIDVTNPYTKQVAPYNQTFEVLVVEPCPESR